MTEPPILKSCPFCTDYATLFQTPDEERPFFQIKCDNPGCYVNPVSFGAPTKDEAAAEWNYRHPSPDRFNVEPVLNLSEPIATTPDSDHIVDINKKAEPQPEDSPIVHTFRINPLGGRNIVAEGNDLFCYAHEVMAYIAWAEKRLKPSEIRDTAIDESRPQNEWNAATVRHVAARQARFDRERNMGDASTRKDEGSGMPPDLDNGATADRPSPAPAIVPFTVNDEGGFVFMPVTPASATSAPPATQQPDEAPYFGFESLSPEAKTAYRAGYSHGKTDAAMEREYGAFHIERGEDGYETLVLHSVDETDTPEEWVRKERL